MKNNIRKIRDLRSISQTELAEKAGVSTITLRKWETDVTEPDAQQLCKLADALNVTTDKILMREPLTIVISEEGECVLS